MSRRTASAPRPFHYSQESNEMPVTAKWLLQWAAEHVVQVGLYQGDHRFASTGRTVTLRASMLGAFDVAGGDGRGRSSREYDWPAVYAARELALVVVSEFVNGGPLDFPAEADEEEQRYLRRQLVHVWGCAEGRTAQDVAEAFRLAAEVADQVERPALFGEPVASGPAEPERVEVGEPEPFGMVLESAPAPAPRPRAARGEAAGAKWSQLRPEAFGKVKAVQPVLFAADSDAMGTGALF